MKGDVKMKEKIVLSPHPLRKNTFFEKTDKAIPQEIFTVNSGKPCLDGFPYPLPDAKKNYTCFAEGDGVYWYGSSNGVTKYDPAAEHTFDKIMYYSADRDLPDNNVKAILAEGRNAWVLTECGVTLLEEAVMSPTEISAHLLKETLTYIDRHGMISQRDLAIPKKLDSAFNYGHSDNDGGFTACFNMGEIFRYAVLKKEKGVNAPETIEAKKVATRALEACLLLVYIHGRGNGFVARTYVTKDEPLPDDGLFFERKGNTATVRETSYSKDRGCVGETCDCSAPIPERLRHLFTDEGYTEDDIIYKGDTSSDEITIQMMNFLFAHKYLTCDDKELDEILKDAVTIIVNHIIDNNYRLVDFSGESTTWARWYSEYFVTEDGYVDGALNSAQLLFYMKAAMEITGEKGKFEETYNHLINDMGYADLTMKHYDRIFQMELHDNIDIFENIMYGDHMLASCAFLGLCILEKDEELLKKYRFGFKEWRTSIAREHNAGYDFMYLIACPDEEIDVERAKEFFLRTNYSRLASGVSMVGRHDIPVWEMLQGYKQGSSLVPPDERFISKYDRDSLEYKNEDSNGTHCVENCYSYTFAYWLGRLYGFVEGE